MLPKKIVLLPIVSEFNFLGNLNYDKVKSEVEKHQSKAVASSTCGLSSHTIRLTRHQLFINSSGKKNCQSKHIDSQSTKTLNFGHFEFKLKTILYYSFMILSHSQSNQSMIMMMVMDKY